jgi:hypothetical protein
MSLPIRENFIIACFFAEYTMLRVRGIIKQSERGKTGMITRTWHGLVPIEKASGFRAYLDRTGVQEARAIEGNLGAYVKEINQNAYTHFFLCTVWASWEDIARFAGNTGQSTHIRIGDGQQAQPAARSTIRSHFAGGARYYHDSRHGIIVAAHHRVDQPALWVLSCRHLPA